MNTNFYQSFFTPAGNSTKYTFFRKASKAKAKPPTLLLAIAVFAIGISISATPAHAQYVTASTYMNNLYQWYVTPTSSDLHWVEVRATFLGASVAANQGVSMGFFDGIIDNFVNYIGPFGKGYGDFYFVTKDGSGQTKVDGPHSVPFTLYSWGPKLNFSLDFTGVIFPYKTLYYQFDKITSQGGWPWGNWTGLNGGAGAACGEVALGCNKISVANIH
jgi:hypothetical protein